MNLDHAANLVLHLILTIVKLIFVAFAAIEIWLRHLLAQLGIHGEVATMSLVLAAILFFLGALRLFGGALQLLVAIFLVLFALQVLFAIAPA